MAPDKQILSAISNEDRAVEIQRRLQDQETLKARKLLALATGSHLQALNITKDIITRQILAITQANGNSRK